MKILVLSDSHHSNINLGKISYDIAIHCGDYGNSYDYLVNNNIHFVRGNCDFKGEKEKELIINNKKIYFTHGHMYNVKMTYNIIIYKASSLDASICLFGHTHNPDVFLIDNILFLNPGSYADGFYAIIEDDSVSIFLNNKIYKKINYKW